MSRCGKLPFKPGDEIVITSPNIREKYEKGATGILVSYEGMWDAWLVARMGEGKKEVHLVGEEEMEHAFVVDSPLWKALM